MEIAEPELLDAALRSRAGRFVRDPELSLRPVELGGFEDGVFQDGSTDLNDEGDPLQNARG